MAAEQRASSGASRVRRLLSRALLVVGGTVAGTAAAWLLSAAPANAAAGPGEPAELAARTTTELSPVPRDAADLAGVLNPANRPVHRVHPPRRGTAPVPFSVVTSPVAGSGDRPEREPAPQPPPSGLADAVTGPVAATLAELTRSATPPAPSSGVAASRPALEQVTAALRDAFGAGGRLTHGGQAQNPVAALGEPAERVPGGSSVIDRPGVAASAPAATVPATGTGAAAGWARTSMPAPASTAAHRSIAPPHSPAPFAPGGGPLIVPVSLCAGQQGAGSSGGHPVGAITSTVRLPGTAGGLVCRSGAPPEPTTLGAQPGVTPD
jgi:hypothetical protein